MSVRPAPGPDDPDDRAALFALLRAVCDEIHSLGCDIVSLGDVLSGPTSDAHSTKRTRDLQAFDAIGQRAIAQARLLQGLERMLSGAEIQTGDGIDRLIECVPFHAERCRLFAAFRGQHAGEGGFEDSRSEDLDLF
jgi:hypothetical protein